MSENIQLPRWLRFVTSRVFYISILGVVLIIIGQSNYLNFLLPNIIPIDSPFNAIVKTIGAAFIGSGVFTAIIKSSEYTEIFSKVIGEIIWSKKYIIHRKDKKEIWSMVSRLMYDEKFPAISNEIEEIISTNYFPVSDNYYTENYEFTINISDHPSNPAFWLQDEVVSMNIKPTSPREKIEYRFAIDIDLPDDASIEDISNYTIESIYINDSKYDYPIQPPEKKLNLYVIT